MHETRSLDNVLAKISVHIEQQIANCHICQKFRPGNQKETLIPHEIPDYPWQTVATDVFTLEKQDYLLVVDYYSNFFEFEKLGNTTSSCIIKCMKRCFSSHGIPQKVVSDNASYYTSQQFKQFVKDWDFKQVFSSPYHTNQMV